MRNNKNKILIIVLVVIAILAIAGGVFAYLFLATDVFKSGQELFAKYLMQNIDDLKEISSLGNVEQLESKLEQSKYEENIAISCSETGDTDPMMQLTVDTQRDALSGKIYSILGLNFEGAEEKMQLEYMQENDMYSLRFTNAVKQFLTVQNSNLKQFAENLGLDEEIIEKIPDTIDFEKFSFEELKFTEEEINAEVNQYLTLLYNNIAKENYQKNKDVVITVNGKTITTNSYVLTLSMQDVRTLVINVLETLKQDEIILGKLQKIDDKLVGYGLDSIKESFEESIQEEINYLSKEEITEQSNVVLTVYEQNKETVRIKLEQDLEYITLDTTKQDGKEQIDINYTSIDEQNTQLSNKISLLKENDNKLNITFSSIDGEEQHTSNINVDIIESENSTKMDMVLETESIQVEISRNVEIVNEIDYNVKLDNSNNLILNNLSTEQLSSIFSALGGRLVTEYVEPLEPVLSPVIMILGMMDSVDLDGETAGEDNDFNSKFTSYEGTGKDQEEITSLIAIVDNHNSKEAQTVNPRYVTITGDIEYGPDSDSVIWPEGEWNYSVQCFYEDGYVNEIWVEKEEKIQNDQNSYLDDIEF